MRLWLGIATVLAVASVGAAVGCGSTEESVSGDNATDTTTTEEEESNKATDNNEPHLGPKGTVIVDTLTWKVLSARSAATVGDGYLEEKATNGVFVVVKTRVRNGKDESVTISDDLPHLVVDEKEYHTDPNAASRLEDEEIFLFFKDLGPDVALTGAIVFDVPKSVLKRNPEVCFGKLGLFRSTQGCIRLPV